MTDNAEEILAAENFVREAATELSLMQDRSKALAKARTELEQATKALSAAAELLRESYGLNRRAHDELRATIEAVDSRVGEVIESKLAGLNERVEQSVLGLQRQLLEADRLRRETLEEGLKAAKRSLLDSAQVLSETSSVLSSNTELLSEVSARDRDQWRFTLVSAVSEAHAHLRAAAEAMTNTSRQAAEATDQRMERLGASANSLAEQASEMEAIMSRARQQDQPSRIDALAGQVKSLRTTIYVVAVVQGILLIGVLVGVAVRSR